MYKNIALILLFVVISVLVFNLFNPIAPTAMLLPFSEFMDKVEKGEVNDVTIKGSELAGNYKTGKSFKTVLPDYPDLVKELRTRGVKVNAEQVKESAWYNFLVVWAPLILMVFWFMFIVRNMQMGGNKAMSFGKSKAKLLNESSKKVTFSEVAGMDEAKVEVQEIIEILKDPQKFQKLGGKIPKGVLLVGPPGTGKTLLARAIAGEAGVPFLSISGSDFVEMFVGVGASRVRDLFEQGKKNAPCIIFIDEIDAVGRHRGAGLGGGHDEREQTLNQLLVEMDGFESNDGVILVAATNRPDVLDPALLRPGRFDRMVVLPTTRPERTDRRAESAYEEDQACPACGHRVHRARHAGSVRGRAREPGQRSGASCRQAGQNAGRERRLRPRQGQDPHGPGTQVHAHQRRRKEEHGLP